MKQPSRERGCEGKTKIGDEYYEYADLMAGKHNKRYGVYLCPHCGSHHLTTKLEKQSQYAPLLYVTKELNAKEN